MKHAGKKPLQPVLRGMDVFDHSLECGQIHQAAVGLAQYFHVEIFLPAKVVVDRGGVDAGKVANLPRRRTLETLSKKTTPAASRSRSRVRWSTVLKSSILVRSLSFSSMSTGYSSGEGSCQI